MRLVICEKPSQAQQFSAVLNAKKRQDGFFEGNDWLISWCYGHLVELAPADVYGEQYKRWAYETLPILPDDWQYRVSADKKKQFNILRTLMKRADVKSIVCATDAGREGELIFRLVYEQAACTKPVQRLWLSSLEDDAVRNGFENLRPGVEFENLYRAALCRSKADYLVGINATWLFSVHYGLTLNVGRVQSPTLALIVNREAAINSFVSEPFYTPQIDCGNFIASGDKATDAAEAEEIRTKTDGKDAVVVSVEKQRKSTAPPKLYDLTALQRDANRLLGFTAQQTLDYTQALYEKKLCSYPRTDSRYLTSDMAKGLLALAEAVSRALPFSDGSKPSIETALVVKDSAVTDHHAIIPTMAMSNVDLLSLPAGARNILFMIATRLLCAVGEKHSYEAIGVTLDCAGYEFSVKGKTVLSDGWKAIDSAFRATLKAKPFGDTEDAENSENGAALPELCENQIFPTVTALTKEGKTSPPARYNDATLLAAMETAGAEGFPDEAERRGLGTPATRAATIEKIIKTGFVERQKKSLVPTAKGINLIAVLPEEIKSPLLTAEWEQKLQLVQSGQLSDSEFMDGITSLTKGLVSAHSTPVPEYAALFATTSGGNSAGQQHGDSIGSCPRCNSSVLTKPKGGGRMPDYFCSNRACKFAMWKDNLFFEAKRKKLDKKTATALLKEGRVFFSDLFSEKTGKTYAATILLEDTGDKVNFKLEFGS
ncbi:MAG: DNA topoisomerase 3 [Defluviitaleaceae bacterium]|nr:DNA topoisomerase 3 [Defluviitaleaceae bacterium]